MENMVNSAALEKEATYLGLNYSHVLAKRFAHENGRKAGVFTPDALQPEWEESKDSSVSEALDYSGMMSLF